MGVEMKAWFIVLVAGAGLFVTGAVAQHEGHEHDQGAAVQVTGKSPMPHMKMLGEQKDTARLVDQLVASLASIQAENDPEALRQELTEHGTLLKELQAKLQAHTRSMEAMCGMKAETRQ